jgi:hypothetical protein
MTRAKHKNNTTNNTQITQNNSGACGSRVESGAAYVLHYKELRLEIGSGAGFEKNYLALVNTLETSSSPASSNVASRWTNHGRQKASAPGSLHL